MPPSEMSCKRGGSWVRPGGNVDTTEDGVKRCAEICKDYKYFGLECPGRLGGESYPPAKVHCQCTNNLAGSQKIEDKNCNS